MTEKQLSQEIERLQLKKTRVLELEQVEKELGKLQNRRRELNLLLGNVPISDFTKQDVRYLVQEKGMSEEFYETIVRKVLPGWEKYSYEQFKQHVNSHYGDIEYTL